MNHKTDKITWAQRIQNLINRRATGVRDNAKCDPIVAEYGRHIRAIQLGASVLDIGCGSQTIRTLLPAGVTYAGLDAFPCVPDTIEGQIETVELPDRSYDTLLCFAMLDSAQDLELATAQMKRIAAKNIVFLTGVDIEPDQFHTFMITEALLDELMSGWTVHMRNYLTPKVMLVEYNRPAND